MPEMRERLFARIPAPRVGTLGIAIQDVTRVKVDEGLLQDLLDCLRSGDDSDIIFGLYFAEVLRPDPDFSTLGEPALSAIASLICASVTHSNPQVRGDAVRAFVAFHSNFDDYATIMREFLNSIDSQVRREALRAAPTFVSAKELHLLLPFRNYPEFGETGGMGGPLRYNLRDFALEIAEHISGQRFDNGDCFEHQGTNKIFWRSWSTFTQ